MVMCGEAVEPPALPKVWTLEPVLPRLQDSGIAQPLSQAAGLLLPAPFSTSSLDTSHRSFLLLRCPVRETFFPAQIK